MRVPASLLNSGPVTVERYLGSSGRGPVYGPSETIRRCRFEGRRKAIRNQQGVDIIGSAVVTVQPADLVPVESKVTRCGRTYEVLEVVVLEGPYGTSGYDLILGGPK